MWDYYTNTMGRDSINVERNSLRHEYATVSRGNGVRERGSLIGGSEAWGSDTTITTPTPYVSSRLGAKLHQVA